MSRHSDFMRYEDNSCPLNDIFTHCSPDWTAKPCISPPNSKTEEPIKDVTSVTDSFIDIRLLDLEPAKASSVRTLTGHASMFNPFPRDTRFSVITDPGLCVDSDQLNADQLSEETGFSGYFSETRTHDTVNPKTSSHTGAMETEKLDAPDNLRKFVYKDGGSRREVQKPPTTAGIKLDHLKAVFHLERPKAEKKLGLKRTTFSNLSRHYGISKWPFRTIRDALNRMEANKRLLDNANVSKERRRKLQRQQELLHDVIDLIYKDPRHSRDSNTLAVLLMIVAAKDDQ